MRHPSIEVRAAISADVPAIRRLHARSLRRLGQGHYPATIIERIIESGTFQPELLRGGRYKVAVSGDRLIGCGGWLEGGPTTPLANLQADPRQRAPTSTAVVRAVYVDPDLARYGIGRIVVASIEAEARAAGKGLMTLLSTAMAVRFYSRLGYAVERPLTLTAPGGGSVEVFAMKKALPAEAPAEVAPSRLVVQATTEPPRHLARAA